MQISNSIDSQAGTNDRIIPVINAGIMHRLLPHSTLHLHHGGTST